MRKALMMMMTAAALLSIPVSALAQADEVVALTPLRVSGVRIGGGACTGATTIYDTTHAANVGAELAPTANGPACSLADRIVLAGTNRFVCEIAVDMFTLNDNSAFDATMTLFTDCTSNGVAGSACGSGTGTLIPGSTSIVTGIQAPALGTIFTVVFPFSPPVDLTGEADNTISVRINPSRNNVLWRINETPVVGSIPTGEPATSFVERCGSTAANNGCSRNFGVNNNFAMTISAMVTPVELLDISVD